MGKAIDNSSHTNYSKVLYHGGNVIQEAARLGINPNNILDASASIVPFQQPQEIIDCLLQTINGIELRSYPDAHHSKLRESIAKWHNVSPSMILPGNGAAELITWAAREASTYGFSTLPSPGFSDYRRALKCWNSSYQELSLPLTWRSDFPEPFPLQSNLNVIWITNPHNPTGQLWSRSSLEKLLKKQTLVICDEAFLPLVPNGEKESLIPLVPYHKNLIVIRSMTKLFAIAGLRLGYAISNSERLEEWQRLRDPWPLNAMAIAIGSMIMNNDVIIKNQINKIATWILEDGHWLHINLQTLKGIKAYPSSVNFQLIQSKNSLINLRERLAQKGILVRDCRSFKGLGESWLRISLQTKDDNKRIIKEMKHILN
tara:strand:- start:321 stop:1436 length:1116 start_codon:yes stop_codon:yes gene_type:complete